MKEKEKSLAVQEYELLRDVFKGNNELLRQIRTLLLGFDVTDDWKGVIKATFSNPAVFKAFRKRIFVIYSEDTPEAPIEAISDVWSNSTNIVSGASQDRIRQEIMMRQESVDMLRSSMELLKNPSGEKVDTDYNSDVTDPWGIKLMARNYFVGSIQQGISQISVMVNTEVPTVAETKKKISKNSAE